MIRIIIFLLATSLVACGGPEKTAENETPVKTNGMVAQELFVQGNRALDAGDYENAINIYQDAAERHPERWDIPMNLAIAYSRTAKFKEALGAIEVAFQNGGKEHHQVYFNLGNIYQERGMYGQAVDAYRAALALQPKPEIDTLVNLGASYLFIFKYDEARATYDYINELFPDDPRAMHGIGLIYQTQSNYPEALEFYENAHRIDSNFSMSYFNKAWVLAQLERYDEAVQSMQTYLDRDPEGPYVNRAKNLINSWKSKSASKS